MFGPEILFQSPRVSGRKFLHRNINGLCQMSKNAGSFQISGVSLVIIYFYGRALIDNWCMGLIHFFGEIRMKCVGIITGNEHRGSDHPLIFFLVFTNSQEDVF